MKKIIILIGIILIPLRVFASDNLLENAKSGILMEYSTGKILYEKESDQKMAPASMTKIMTMLLIFEALESKKISLNDYVTISPYASSMGGSQVYLEPNTNMKVEDLLKSIAIASANDSAVALAEAISGTTDAFVNKMNQKAKALGCINTNFTNVHGLDDNNHYSTSKDMALIARELIKHEDVLKYSSIYESYLKKPDGSSTWMVNTNKLIKYYHGLDGLKTGYTTKAGYCLTATAKRNDMRLISVIMDEPSSEIRNSETIDLLNYGFTNYKIKSILTKEDDLGYIEVINGKKDKVNIRLLEDATNLEEINEDNKYTYNINVNSIKAPVKVGDVVGSLDIVVNSKVIKKVDITVVEDVKKANIWDLYKKNIKLLLGGN